MPTRTGYSFVGWRGRNLFPLDGWVNSQYATFSQTSNSFEVSSISSTSVVQKYICRNNFSLTKGTYYLSYGSYETTGEVDHPSIEVCQYESSVEYEGWSRVSETSNVTDTRQITYFYLPNDDDNLRIVIYVSINASSETGTVKVTDLMLTKIADENEVVKYEPYYITRNVKFLTPGDCTLTAEWASGGISNDMRNWQTQLSSTFSNWSVSGNTNSFDFNGVNGWETKYVPLSCEQDKIYSITFDYVVPNFSYSMYGCDNSLLAYVSKEPLIYSMSSYTSFPSYRLGQFVANYAMKPNTSGTARITFTAQETRTYYFGINFGYAGDGQTLRFTFSNFSLSIEHPTLLEKSIETDMRKWASPGGAETCFSSWQVSNGVNSFLLNGVQGAEFKNTPVELEKDRMYIITFDYVLPYFPYLETSFDSSVLLVNLLTSQPPDACVAPNFVAGTLNSILDHYVSFSRFKSNTSGSAKISFTAPYTGTFYFGMNFGTVGDTANLSFKFSDFKLFEC